MLYSIRILATFVCASLLASCAGQRATFASGEPCETRAFTVEDSFSGARRGKCTVLSANHVRLRILPESEGYINDSPWCAFRLVPAAAGTAEITLRYEGGHHRYWPKISGDGLHWLPLDEQYVSASDDGLGADFNVPLRDGPVWVAAQEIVVPALYDAWNRVTTNATGIPLRLIGSSVAGLPINAFDSNPESSEVLFIVGRQHPPEVSGAIAFFTFTETLFGDSELLSRERLALGREEVRHVDDPLGVLIAHDVEILGRGTQGLAAELDPRKGVLAPLESRARALFRELGLKLVPSFL